MFGKLFFVYFIYLFSNVRELFLYFYICCLVFIFKLSFDESFKKVDDSENWFGNFWRFILKECVEY